MNRTAKALADFQAKFKALFDSGVLRIEQYEVVGVAEDGAEVRVGEISTLHGIELATLYLEDRPTPDCW